MNHNNNKASAPGKPVTYQTQLQSLAPVGGVVGSPPLDLDLISPHYKSPYLSVNFSKPLYSILLRKIRGRGH